MPVILIKHEYSDKLHSVNLFQCSHGSSRGRSHTVGHVLLYLYKIHNMVVFATFILYSMSSKIDKNIHYKSCVFHVDLEFLILF